MLFRSKSRKFLVSLPVAAALFAGALVGCGDKSNEEQITSAARQFAGDIRNEDWKGVCGSFSRNATDQVLAAAKAAGIKDCPTFMKRAFSANAGASNLADVKPEDVKVTKIIIKGDLAVAQVVPSNDPDPSTNFIRENGKWKIDGDTPQPEEQKKGAPTTTGAGGG